MQFEKLLLYSSDIPSLKHFYSEVLKCSLLTSADNSFEMQWGHTRLRFEQRHDATPYHFAINIPPGKIEEAASWLKERVPILRGDGQEIIDFSSWKAHSVYFYDRDHNIVELIARQKVKSNHTGSFSTAQFLGVSEIGVPVKDIEQAYDRLHDLTAISFPIFSGGFDVFCAVGDDNGLFIMVDKNQKDWFPTGDETNSSPFQIHGRQKDRPFALEFAKGQFLGTDSP